MTTESSLLHTDPEDIFAKAIERVEAGEAIETVLATAPEAMRAELRELLLLITATHHLQRAPVPQPASPRRADRKAAFLEAAAQMKPVVAAVSTPVHAPTRTVAVPKAPPTKVSFGAWVANFWNDLQMGFASPNLRLSPLVIIIVVVWLGSFRFSEVAAAAAIGDLAYPVKQWARNQQLTLASEAARGSAYQKKVYALLDDLTLTTAKLSAEEQTTGYRTAQVSTEVLIFEGVAADHLIVGSLPIMMRYQPDPNLDEYVDIVMPVMPGIGQQVELTFQIVTTNDPNAPTPFILQGIQLTVPEVQLAIGPTPTAEPTATATTTPTATPCIGFPAGWVPYVVRDGDSLSAIAQRTGTTLAELQQANCLVNVNAIVAGNRLMAPAIQQANTPTATQVPLEATLTAISTTVLTPSVGITPTVTVVPTHTVTSTVTATVTTEATPVISATATTTATVIEVGTPTPIITITLTSEAGDSGTVVATETMTDAVDPAPGTPIAPTAETTLEATTTPEAEGTIEGASGTPESGEATPTPSPTFTATSEPPTATATPQPMIEPTTKATDEPTTEAPTGESKEGNSGTSTQGVLPTPTRTPVPQNESPLTGG